MLDKATLIYYDYLQEKLEGLKRRRIEVICECKELDVQEAQIIENEIKKIEKIIILL
jgi:hypothetical protein